MITLVQPRSWGIPSPEWDFNTAAMGNTLPQTSTGLGFNVVGQTLVPQAQTPSFLGTTFSQMLPLGNVQTPAFGSVPVFSTATPNNGVQSTPAVVVLPQERQVPQYIMVSPLPNPQNPVGIWPAQTQSQPPNFGAPGFNYTDINFLFNNPLLRQRELVNVPYQVPRLDNFGNLSYQPINQAYLPALQPYQSNNIVDLMRSPAVHPGNVNALLTLGGIQGLPNLEPSPGMLVPPVFFASPQFLGGQVAAGF